MMILWNLSRYLKPIYLPFYFIHLKIKWSKFKIKLFGANCAKLGRIGWDKLTRHHEERWLSETNEMSHVKIFYPFCQRYTIFTRVNPFPPKRCLRQNNCYKKKLYIFRWSGVAFTAVELQFCARKMRLILSSM